MPGTPGDPEFDKNFVDWYVWASRNLTLEPRRCHAAAWAAVMSTGTQEDSVAAARKAAFGPEVDQLSEAPPPELRARAEEAARVARPQRGGWVRTCGILAVAFGITLLVLGGVCYALVQLNSGAGPR